MEWELSSPVWSTSTGIGLRDQEIQVSHSTDHCSTHSAGGSPTFAGTCPQLSKRVLGELPLPPQPVLQEYHILNTSRYRGPQVVMRTAVRSASCQSLHDGAGEVLYGHVGCHLICKSGLIGISPSRWAWKLAQIVRLKLG